MTGKAIMQIHSLTIENIPVMLSIEEAGHLAPWSKDVFERCFDAGYYIWGLSINEELVGFIIYSLQVGECHILNLCIHPKHQHQGYGRRLLDHGLKLVKEKEAGIVFLEVRRSNVNAISLYHKVGFVEVGVRKGYYPIRQGREDAIILAKDLSV